MRHGVSAVNAALEACRNGHAFDEANTYLYNGRRHCRKCRAARQKVRYDQGLATRSSAEVQRNAYLVRAFRITLADYEALLAAQDGVCAGCLQPETIVVRGRVAPLAVDHDHVTGKVRGLLCYNCNRGLGQLRDSPETLRRLAAYVEREAVYSA